jgi:WD40 repeat protein
MKIKKLFIFLYTFFCCVNVFATELQSPLLPQGEHFQNFKILLDNVMPRKPVLAIALSPDGKTLASSIEDTVYLWDIYSGREIKRLKGYSEEIINTVAFSFDGNILAAGSSDDSVYIWDMALGGEPIKRLKRHSDDVVAVAFNPTDENILASSSVDNTLYVWNWLSGKVIKPLEGHTASVNAVAFNPEGKILASGGSDSVVYLWEVSSGQKIQKLEGHTDAITAVKFSPDGSRLVSSSWDNTVRLWNVQSGLEIQPFKKHPNSVNTVDFSPNGKMLASGARDNIVRLWDLQSDKKMSLLLGHTNNIAAVAFSPDGKFLVSGSWDKTVRLWDVQAAQTVRTFEGHSSDVNSIAFSPNGKTLASGSDAHGITLWYDMPESPLTPLFKTGIRQLATDYHLIKTLAFSPNEKMLAFATEDKRIHLLNMPSGQKIKHLEGHSEEINVIAFSPNGKILASGSRYSSDSESQDDTPLRLWNVQSGKEISRLMGHTQHVYALAFSPNGKTLASGSDDKTIRLWKIPSGEEIKVLNGHSHFVTTVAFSPDGNLLASGAWDNKVRLWDIQSGKERELEGHSHHVTTVTFSPDGKILASGSRDNTVRLWNIKLAKEINILSGHSQSINSIAFSVDGNRLASSSMDNSIRLWDVNTGELQQVMIKGAKNTWASCHVLTQRCWRADDGTLLIDKQSDGNIQPVFPPVKKAKPVSVEFSPDSVKFDYGNPSSLTLTIRNNDIIPVYGINIIQQFEKNNPLIFYPPETQVVLKPNQTITLSPVKVNAWLDDENLQRQKATLKLSVSAANSDNLPLNIPVYINIPYSFVWLGYIFLSILLIMTSFALYYLFLYRAPIVQMLSADSSQLLTLPLEQLPKAKQLLQKARRLDTVLSDNDSNTKWLDEAIDFINQPNQTCCELLATRLSATTRHHNKDNNHDVFVLQLNAEFPLNLVQCFICFPVTHIPVQEIIWQLKKDDMNFQITVVISLESRQQTDLRSYAEDRTNLWVIPNSRELTNLLLSPHPIDVFTRILANQLAITRLSPYQTSGGITKENLFFGRKKILAQILNSELKNYLVIGGRQLGKTSLLKQIQRHYQNHPKVECVYLSVSRGDKRVVNEHLTDLPTGRQRLLLIDEADVFIRKEIAEGYPTLSHFRNLSEEGKCYFIITGFWDLYEAAVLDYHSPIKNFGEPITISALELEACQDLAIKPMKMLGIHYAEDKFVEQIINATGQRANLVATICDEMLKNLVNEERILTQKAVNHALKSHAIFGALGGWSKLTDDEQAVHLDRIIVYATVEKGEFKLSEVMAVLDKHKYNYDTEQLMQSLARLELAFIIQYVDDRYNYCVPLFRKMLLKNEVKALLQQELKSSRNGIAQAYTLREQKQ